MITYHYTSINTLFNILSGIKHKPEPNANIDDIDFYFLKLHSSNSIFLNDPTEIELYLEALLEAFNNNSDLESVIKSNWFLGTPYVLSFSELEDDLNMWIKYADNAQGVALGFDLNEDIIKEKNNKFDDIQILKCEYQTKDKLIKKIKKQDGYKQIKKDLKNRTVDTEFRIDNILRDVRLNSLRYKNIAYQSEKEWRLFVFADFDSKFKCRKNEIVNYKEVLIPLSALKQIKFAPLTDFNKLNYSVNKFIEKKTNTCFTCFKKDVKISKSKIPYTSKK